MKTIRFTRQQYDALRGHLFRGTGNEEAAFLVAGSSRHGSDIELYVREVVPVPPGGLLSQGPCHLDIDPDFMAPIIKRCRIAGLSLIDVHSHPGSGPVGFSGIDDGGDARLLPAIKRRVPGRDHASLVLNVSSIDGRMWLGDAAEPAPIDRMVIVGQPIEVIDLSSGGRDAGGSLSPYQRQVLMFGEEGQRLIGSTAVAIIGCGGLGSMIIQKLAHLGVGRLIPVDHDFIDETNLSRIVGATPEDLGLPKVGVARRHALSINPGMVVDAMERSVMDEEVALRLLAADILVCGTDTVASRMVLNRLAYQYVRPLVDCGIDIKVTPAGKAKVLGRVMTTLPGGPCLSCAGVVDPDTVAAELAQAGENAGYVQGERMPDPSVVTLNGVVASLAATEVLDLIVGFKDADCAGPDLTYYGHKGFVASQPIRRVRRCVTCSEALGAGDALRLPCPGQPLLNTR